MPSRRAAVHCGQGATPWRLAEKVRSDSLYGNRARAISRRERHQESWEPATMVMDLSAQMMQATVQLEQPLGDGTRTVGTGLLITETTPDGKPHTILEIGRASCRERV